MRSLIDSISRSLPVTGPFASPGAQRVLLGVLVVAAVAFPLVMQTPPLDLREGAPAPRTIRAPRSVQYVDEAATRAVRDEAAAAVEPVLAFDGDAVRETDEAIAGFFATVAGARAAASQTASAAPLTEEQAMRAELARVLPELDAESIASLATLDAAGIEAAGAAARGIAGRAGRFTAEELPERMESLAVEIEGLGVSEGVREVIGAVVDDALVPTLVIDAVATEAARAAAAAEVDSIVVAKQAGENIVLQGAIVSATDLEIIRRLGLLEQSGSAASLAAIVGLAALLVVSAGAYVWRYDERVWSSLRDLLILATIFVGMVWVARLVLWWRPDISIYLLPVPLAAMLATLLLSAREGMLIAVVTSLAAVMLGFSSGDTVVATLVWSVAAVVAVSYITDRRRMFYVGTALIGMGAAVGGVATLASGAPASEALTALGYGAAGGLLAIVLTYGLLPFFEHIFGVTTDVRLLELANPAHPLLRELMTAAPGTYSHSVMTANLAESAAEAIGANPLLARVGAYYHDVGKLRRPGFFVENQAGGENPHDSTAPSLSAIIITSHVKEGVELAEKHKLPREVVDIVRQHHGTSLVSYFYNKAAESEDKVYEADFRYDGERPASREAALVMLADSCEAAVRALKKPTVTRIEASVRSVVDGKVADSQLDEADLTFAQIERVIGVYGRLLASVYHPRVEYPGTTTRRSGHAQHPAHEPSRS